MLRHSHALSEMLTLAAGVTFTMFTISVEHVTMLTYANQHVTQSAAETGGNVVNFADIWSQIKLLDKFQLR